MSSNSSFIDQNELQDTYEMSRNVLYVTVPYRTVTITRRFHNILDYSALILHPLQYYTVLCSTVLYCQSTRYKTIFSVLVTVNLNIQKYVMYQM